MLYCSADSWLGWLVLGCNVVEASGSAVIQIVVRYYVGSCGLNSLCHLNG